MRRSITNSSVAAVSVCFCLLLISSGWAAQQPNVLVLNSYNPGYHWSDGIVEGIRSEFNTRYPDVSLFVEYLDSRRVDTNSVFPVLKQFYQEKYKDTKFDIIISCDNSSLEFLGKYKKELFPDVPVVFVGVDLFKEAMFKSIGPVTGIGEVYDKEATANIAIRLHSHAKRMVFVRNRFRDNVINFEWIIEKLRKHIECVDLFMNDMTVEEFIAEISKFKDDTIVILPNFLSDLNDRLYTDSELLKVLQSCDAPIYLNIPFLIGSGPVGGSVNIGSRHGALAGDMAIRILKGESAENIDIIPKGPTDFTFDYQQLKRFNISFGELPANAIIVNEPKSFYYRYKTRVWLVGSVFLVLTGMILLLLVNIINRRRVEAKLLNYQVQLKSSASELSLAEERERRRIATELHDRISQSLVISKVMLEQLRETEASDHVAGVLDDACNMLGQTIENSRLLTFDLSSPILYELGFEAAVADLLTEQVGRHNIATELEDDGQVKPLDNDIRGVLFRMVRELLINVVKHAQATCVKVSINRADGLINICVQDDGVGFEPAQIKFMDAKAGGFGLFSIRERLEQLGGRLDIKSSPGRGCRVHIAAPLKV